MSQHEWLADEIRRVGRLVVDLIADHYAALPDEPVFRPVPPDVAARLAATPPPRDPVSPDDILGTFAELVEPYPFGNGHPRFWGWVNSPPALMGVFAEALAAALNPSCAGGNHAAIHVEHEVIGWFRELLRFPAGSAGLLVSGGSMATLTALAVARHQRCGVDVRTDGLRAAPRAFAFYMSSEAHACARKAIELLGFGSGAIRTVPAGTDFAIDLAALEAALTRDRAAGVQPVAVIATAGSTNTGAIDDLDAVADICNRHRVWLHVDAAYGGPAILSSEYAGRLGPLSRADSVALDPHKWMFVPVEAGFILLRDGDAMRSAFSLVPPYLRTDGNSAGVGGPPWFSEFGFQQTRGFRALKVWMTMQQFGVEGYRAAIDENIALARYLADSVRDATDFELVTPPSLSVVCFRLVSASFDSEAAVDAANRALLERLQLGGEAFLTSTELGGRFVLRACVVNYRSTRGDIDRMLNAVRAIGRELITERSGTSHRGAG